MGNFPHVTASPFIILSYTQLYSRICDLIIIIYQIMGFYYSLLGGKTKTKNEQELNKVEWWNSF